MSIRDSIELLYNNNTNYSNPSQATNQASSLSALSKDLYTDSKRFIYELLQNADDSVIQHESVKVCIKLFDEYLVIAHTGKTFDSDDIRGICNINNGTKKGDSNKTGYKGIGFKSVFGQSEKVIVFSNDEYFRFDSSYDFGWNVTWDLSQVEWEEENKRKFMYPWQIIPVFTEDDYIQDDIRDFLVNGNWTVSTIIRLENKEETQKAIRELSQNVNMFLFLKNISEIVFDFESTKKIEINRTVDEKITLKLNGLVKTNWITYTLNLQVPDKIKIAIQSDQNIPDKLKTAESIEIMMAAKIGESGISKLNSDEKLLYSYLPTDETKYSLPVLVNTSFLTNANREHLHIDSEWNQWIFKNIAIEIFRWISKLVQTEVQSQAYKLIPEDTCTDELGKQFNKGIKEAIDTIPFILSIQDQLVKVKDSIVDFTYLSNKYFIGKNSIKSFIANLDATGAVSSMKFIQNTIFNKTFKNLGVKCFEWKDLPEYLKSNSFISRHTIKKNIALIKHFKKLSENKSVKDINIEKLREFYFIWDHKDCLNIPSQVYFPTVDDIDWANPDNKLAFIHKDLQDWLSIDFEMRAWIEQLGVVEKTDITYVTKTIIPNAENYITPDNAIQTIRDLFNIYSKGDLDKTLLSQLTKLKLVTKTGKLVPASKCFLSDIYSPRIVLEDVLTLNIFVSEDYLIDGTDKDEFKRFFRMLGVNDRISFTTIPY